MELTEPPVKSFRSDYRVSGSENGLHFSNPLFDWRA
jgi:hypothetical protein